VTDQPGPHHGYPPPTPWGAYGPPLVVTPPPRRSRRTAWIVVSVVAGVLLLGLIGCLVTVGGIGRAVHNDQQRANGDVTLTHCAITELVPGLNVGQADITVHNSGTGRASYLVEVRFESRDGGHSYGTGYASIEDLGAGQTGSDQAVGSDNIPDGLSAKCVVINVTRL